MTCLRQRTASGNQIVVERGRHLYVFRYDDAAESRQELLKLIGRMAADPEYDFTWYDAACVCQQARLLAEGA